MIFENFKSKPNSHVINLRFIRQRPGIPAYLKEEGRFYAAIRARLRFGIATVNFIRHQRGQLDSPDCLTCKTPDTIAHMLLHCTDYQPQRNQCIQELTAAGLHFNLPTLLSEDDE